MNDHFEKKCQFEKNMNNQIEQNYEQSIWTEISTIIFEQKCQQSILNKKVNKQFEQKNQQLTRRKT